MHYTRLGNSGLIVSRLAFGAMTFGSDPSQPAIYKVDPENAKSMMVSALDAGTTSSTLPTSTRQANQKPCSASSWANAGKT